MSIVSYPVPIWLKVKLSPAGKQGVVGVLEEQSGEGKERVI